MLLLLSTLGRRDVGVQFMERKETLTAHAYSNSKDNTENKRVAFFVSNNQISEWIHKSSNTEKGCQTFKYEAKLAQKFAFVCFCELKTVKCIYILQTTIYNSILFI